MWVCLNDPPTLKDTRQSSISTVMPTLIEASQLITTDKKNNESQTTKGGSHSISQSVRFTLPSSTFSVKLESGKETIEDNSEFKSARISLQSMNRQCIKESSNSSVSSSSHEVVKEEVEGVLLNAYYRATDKAKSVTDASDGNTMDGQQQPIRSVTRDDDIYSHLPWKPTTSVDTVERPLDRFRRVLNEFQRKRADNIVSTSESSLHLWQRYYHNLTSNDNNSKWVDNARDSQGRLKAYFRMLDSVEL